MEKSKFQVEMFLVSDPFRVDLEENPSEEVARSFKIKSKLINERK